MVDGVEVESRLVPFDRPKSCVQPLIDSFLDSSVRSRNLVRELVPLFFGQPLMLNSCLVEP